MKTFEEIYKAELKEEIVDKNYNDFIGYSDERLLKLLRRFAVQYSVFRDDPEKEEDCLRNFVMAIKRIFEGK